jgi:hypothetical protein
MITHGYTILEWLRSSFILSDDFGNLRIAQTAFENNSNAILSNYCQKFIGPFSLLHSLPFFSAIKKMEKGLLICFRHYPNACANRSKEDGNAASAFHMLLLLLLNIGPNPSIRSKTAESRDYGNITIFVCFAVSDQKCTVVNLAKLGFNSVQNESLDSSFSLQ